MLRCSSLRGHALKAKRLASTLAGPAVELLDGGTQDVRNIYCIGRNYAAHAIELNNEVPKEEPVVFLKASSAARSLAAGPIAFADEEFHHEIELVLLVGEAVPLGSLQPGAEAACVSHVGLGLDLTRRGKQTELKSNGLPWTLAKSFCGSALLSPFSLAGDVRLGDISFELSVNDEVRQSGHVERMIFDMPFQLRYINSLVPLLPGDLLFTGTPEGVGPLRRGDAVCLRYLSPPPLDALRFDGAL